MTVRLRDDIPVLLLLSKRLCLLLSKLSSLLMVGGMSSLLLSEHLSVLVGECSSIGLHVSWYRTAEGWVLVCKGDRLYLELEP